ncbi:unnamed protein product [Discula destructiva]
MLLHRAVALPRPCHTRLFSTTSPAYSALFNLPGLANSRESQYLSKETGIPRTEYSSNIHLIRSSEVDPFGPNAPGASKYATLNSRPTHQRGAPPSAPAAPAIWADTRDGIDDLAQAVINAEKRLRAKLNHIEMGIETPHTDNEITRLRNTRAAAMDRLVKYCDSAAKAPRAGLALLAEQAVAARMDASTLRSKYSDVKHTRNTLTAGICVLLLFLYSVSAERNELRRSKAEADKVSERARAEGVLAAHHTAEELHADEETTLFVEEPTEAPATESHDPSASRKKEGGGIFSFLWASSSSAAGK